MKEEVTAEDVTVLVRGFFYKVPYYVLAEDGIIRSETATFMREEYTTSEDLLTNIAIKLKNWCTGKDELTKRHILLFIRAVIALKQEEYYAYRYVKLTDYNDDNEACKAYVHQFPEDSTLTRLVRELSFYAGAQFKELQIKKNASTGQLH